MWKEGGKKGRIYGGRKGGREEEEWLGERGEGRGERGEEDLLLPKTPPRPSAEGHEVSIQLFALDEPAFGGEDEGIGEVGGGDHGGAEVH